MTNAAHQTVSVTLTAETGEFQQSFRASQEDLDRWKQSAEGAGAEARETGQRLDNLGAEAREAGQRVERAGDAFTRATRPLRGLGEEARSGRAAMDALDDTASRLPGPLAAMARAAGPVGLALGAAAAAATLGAAAIARAGDAYTAATGRLRAATGSVSAAAETYRDLYAVALDTGAALDDTVGTFVRFNIAAQSVGATRDEVAALVETVQKFGIVSGASTAEVSAGAQQLAQALASGRLQGDELRSILENMPLLAKALAENLGVSIGQLREMGAAGELTARRVFDALADAGQESDRLFEAMPLTIERASSSLETAWDRFLVQLDQGLGLSERIAAALSGAAGALDSISRTPTVQERIAAIDERLNELRAGGGGGVFGTGVNLFGGSSLSFGPGAAAEARLKEQRRLLVLVAEEEEKLAAMRAANAQYKAEQAAAETRRTEALAAFQDLQADLLTQQERARQDYAERITAIDAAAAAGADEAEVAAARAAAERDLQEALEKGNAAGRRAAAEAERRHKAIADTVASLRVQVASETALAAAYRQGREAVAAHAVAQEAATVAQRLGIAADSAEAATLGELIERLHEARDAREAEAAVADARDRLEALQDEAEYLRAVASERSLNADQMAVIASLTERQIDLTSEQARKEIALAATTADRLRQVEMLRAGATSWRDGAVSAIHDVTVAANDNAAIAESAFSSVFSSWQDTFSEFFRDFSRGIADVGDLVSSLGDAVLDQVARIAAQQVTASLASTAASALGLGGGGGAGGTAASAAAAGGQAAGGAGSGGIGLDSLGSILDLVGLGGGGSSIGTSLVTSQVGQWLGLSSSVVQAGAGPLGAAGSAVGSASVIPTATGSIVASGISAAPWGMVGSLGASMLGFSSGNQWADMGLSTLGSVGGGMAGAALGGAALGSVAGPIGAAVGAFAAMALGDVIGGMFGQPVPNASQSIDIVGGQVLAKAPEGRLLSDEEIAQWGEASRAALVGPLETLASALDLTDYAVATSWKDGSQRVEVHGGTLGDQSGRLIEVGGLGEAGLIAIRTIVEDLAQGDDSLAGALAVVRDSTAATAAELSAQIAIAADWRGAIDQAVAGLSGAAGAQIAALDEQAAAWTDQARAMIVPAAQVADILTAAGELDGATAAADMDALVRAAVGLGDAARPLSAVEQQVALLDRQMAGLSDVLREAGASAEDAAATVAGLRDELLVAARADWTDAQRRAIDGLDGRGYINDIRDQVVAYDQAFRDAAALGADGALVWRRAMLDAQRAVGGLDLRALAGARSELAALSDGSRAFGAALAGVRAAMDDAAQAARAAGLAREAEWQRRTIAATTGGSLAGDLSLFDSAAQAELAAAAEAGYADIRYLEQALAVERIAILERYGQAERQAREDALRESLRYWQDMADLAQSTGQDIRTYLNGLAAASGPGISAADAYAAAQTALTGALGTIASSDDETAVQYALGQITTLADQFLAASQTYNASSADYVADLTFVQTALDALASALGTDAYDADAEMTALLGEIRANTSLSGPLAKQVPLADTFRSIFGGPGSSSYLYMMLQAQDQANDILAQIAAMPTTVTVTVDGGGSSTSTGGGTNISTPDVTPGLSGQQYYTWAEYSAAADGMTYDQKVARHNAYLDRYPDVAAFVDSRYDPVGNSWDGWPSRGLAGSAHFINHGQYEGRYFAAGGWVDGPGGPTDDAVAAHLSAGEFVVRAAAAGQWGGLLESINDNTLRVAPPQPPMIQPVVVPLPWAGQASPAPGDGTLTADLLARIEARLAALETALRDEARDTRRADGALTGELSGHLIAVREALADATGSAALASRAAVGGRR